MPGVLSHFCKARRILFDTTHSAKLKQKLLSLRKVSIPSKPCEPGTPKKLHNESRQPIVFSRCQPPVCSACSSLPRTLHKSKEHLHPWAEKGGRHIVLRCMHGLHPCSPWSIKALTFIFALCCAAPNTPCTSSTRASWGRKFQI